MKEQFGTLVGNKEMRFFISYKWNLISDQEADRICEQLCCFQINPIRDKFCLNYGDSIMSYMNTLCRCDGVIILISDDYFFSVNCMYEGILAMQNCKNKSIIRILENSVFSKEFSSKIVEYWDSYNSNGMFDGDKEKINKIYENYQEFVFWVKDTNAVNSDDYKKFEKELKKFISRVFLEGSEYMCMVEDLESSKFVAVSKVCDSSCEEYYRYKNIKYSIHNSPVDYFNCLYNFVITLEKFDTNECEDIQINNVVGIQEGNMGDNFSKYYFVIPTQDSLDKLAFEEKLEKEKSEIEYDKRRIVISF